jgi:hypothetical protein
VLNKETLNEEVFAASGRAMRAESR